MVVWTTSKFARDNPAVVKAFLAALEEAHAQIKVDLASAAKIALQYEPARMTASEIEGYIRLPEIEWTTTPKQVMPFAAFMNKTGVLKSKPSFWQDVFFDLIHDRPGS